MPRGKVQRRKAVTTAASAVDPPIPPTIKEDEWARKRVKEDDFETLDLAPKSTNDDDSSCSSSEEQKRKTTQRKKQKVISNEPVLPVPKNATTALFGSLQGSNVNIQDFDAFFNEHPNMYRMSQSSSRKDKLSDFAQKQLADPFRSTLFRDMIAKLPRPGFVCARLDSSKNPEAVVTELKAARVWLPELSRAFQSSILVKAGVYEIAPGRPINFPPCAQSNECMGLKLRIKGGKGAILMAFQYPDEFERLKKYGGAPLRSCPCLLCLRYYACTLVLTMRAYGATIEEQKDFIFQIYRSKFGPDGYNPAFALHPQVGECEGFVDPLLRVITSGMQWMTLENGQECIDESALYYYDQPTAVPSAGERMLDFLQRSSNKVRGVTRLSGFGARRVILPHQDPRKLLLRQAPVQRESILSSGLNLLSDKKVTLLPEASYEIAITVDTLLRLQRAGSITSDTHIDLFSSVVCEDTLVLDDAVLYKCVLFEEKTFSQDDHFCLVIEKSLPRRCATRKMDTVVGSLTSPNAGILNGKTATALREASYEIVCCALLANFKRIPHTSRHHMSDPRVRSCVYAMIEDSGQIMKHTLQVVPKLLVFAMRQYIVAVVEDDPAIKRVVWKLFNWPAFCAIIDTAMVDAGKIFCDCVTSNGYHLPVPGTDAYDHMTRDIDNVLTVAHKKMLEICYQKPYPAFERDMHNLKHSNPELIRAIRIPKAHADALSLLVKSSHPAIYSWADVIVPVLPAFGFSEESIVALQNLYNSYKLFHVGAKVIKQKLTTFIEQYATLWQYCLYSSEEWRKNSELVSYPLPLHYLVHQIDAIRRRYHLESTDEDMTIPDYDAFLLFCPICLSVLSLVVGNDTTCKKHSLAECNLCHKKYTHGYNAVPCDFSTGQLYCPRFHPEVPSDTKGDMGCNVVLERIRILGQLVKIKNMWYTICCSCGHKMSLDPAYCVYDSTYVCRVCSIEILHEGEADKKKRTTTDPPLYSCRVCTKTGSNAVNFFNYPCNVVVCKAHHKDEYNENIERVLSEVDPAERDDKLVVAYLLHFRDKARAATRAQYANKEKNALSLARRRNRANTRR